MTTSADAALASWDRWVTEIEDHPLDEFEYEALLTARDRADEELEIAGDQRLWTRGDAIDARFREVTVEQNGADFNETTVGWWWRRLPATAEAQRYLRADG